MDKTSIIGIILGIIAVTVGMVLKGVGAGALINPAALLIIFVGTAASVLIAFPVSTIKKIPSYFKILLKEEEQDDIPVLIEKFSKMSDQARREGLLSLETEIEAWDDDFISSGLQLTVDGHSPEFIREVMLEKIYAMETRHEEGAAVFTQAGTYAPTLGVLGAVIGLIAALGNMDDMEILGEAIAAAFVATLLGIFSGYVLWHPFANKLRQKSKKEIQRKEIIVEGILSVVNGDSPAAMRDKLSSYLTSKEIAKIKQVTEDE
ncbi:MULTISPECIES: flagellar motor stator protein MotA [unclassified Oceanobacillus]|uniref:flagellar motor stator protein MotA n=1 Tax=unclassified Oceanobacillus TaxID=2630292 RepID=UPI0012EC591A|nr:flagellar motor stator protein MotA [Oceanobacillus sp. AG]